MKPASTTRTVGELTDSELNERIDYLKRVNHLGTFGEQELSKAQAEVTKRTINRRSR